MVRDAGRLPAALGRPLATTVDGVLAPARDGAEPGRGGEPEPVAIVPGSLATVADLDRYSVRPSIVNLRFDGYASGVIERSPFPYQGPLPADQVSGGDELVADLERRSAAPARPCSGPAGTGKTSVLKRVSADLEAAGADTVWIDLYELSSMADLAAAVDRGLAGVAGNARRVLDGVAASVSIRLGIVGVELSNGRRVRPDPVLTLRSLLQVLVRTAERQELLVVFDEFSGTPTSRAPPASCAASCSTTTRSSRSCSPGSQPSTMRTLFADQAAPFFAQADLVEIGPLPDSAVTAMSPTASSAPSGARRGHASPRRRGRGTPAAGHAAGRRAVAPHPAGQGRRRRHLGGTLAEVWETVDSGSERLYELLPSGHQKTLRVLAPGGSIYGSAAEVLDLSAGTARAAADALVGSGYLVRRG